MNESRKSTSIYFLVIVLLYALQIGFLCYSDKQTTYDQLSNQLYFDNIMLISNGGAIDWDDVGDNEQYRVYMGVSSNCRVLLKDNANWSPPMLSGVYPKEAIGPMAVIGKNLENTTCFDEKGNQWIHFIEQDFRVTGIIGAEYATSCDQLAILFNAQFVEDDLQNATLIVDAKTKSGANNIKKVLLDEYPGLQIQAGEIRGTARLTKSSYFYKLLYLQILLVTIFSLIIFGKLRHEKNKTIYEVYQICGIPLSHILLKGEFVILIANTVALFVVGGLGYLLGCIEISRWESVLLIFGGMIALSMLFEGIFFGEKVLRLTSNNKKTKNLAITVMKGRGRK